MSDGLVVTAVDAAGVDEPDRLQVAIGIACRCRFRNKDRRPRCRGSVRLPSFQVSLTISAAEAEAASTKTQWPKRHGIAAKKLVNQVRDIISVLLITDRPEKRSHEIVPKSPPHPQWLTDGAHSSTPAEEQAESATDTFILVAGEKIGQAIYVAKYFRKAACPKVAKTPENRIGILTATPRRPVATGRCKDGGELRPDEKIGRKSGRLGSDADGTRTRNHRIDSPGL